MPDNEKLFELHGRQYTLHKLTVTKSVTLITRLSHLFGDSLVQGVFSASQIDNANKNGNENGNAPEAPKEVTAEQLQMFAQKLQIFGKLRDDDILDIARIVFPFVLLNNAPLYKANDYDMDRQFQGYELDFWRVLWEAVAFNLGNFTQGVARLFPNVKIPTGLQP